MLSPSYISYFNLNTTFSTFFSALYKCNHWWRYDLYQNIWYYCKKTVALFETWFRTLAYSSIVPLLIYIYIYLNIYIYIYNISIILSIYLLLTNKTLSEQIIPWNFKMKFCLNRGLVQKFLGKKLKTLTVFVCEITICWIVL